MQRVLVDGQSPMKSAILENNSSGAPGTQQANDFSPNNYQSPMHSNRQGLITDQAFAARAEHTTTTSNDPLPPKLSSDLVHDMSGLDRWKSPARPGAQADTSQSLAKPVKKPTNKK